MTDINFHQPYQGREDNRYTFKIQKLYEYQYLLQEITKELQKMLKQMPEYKNADICATLLSLTTPAADEPTINLSRPDAACSSATPLVSNYLVLRPFGN